LCNKSAELQPMDCMQRNSCGKRAGLFLPRAMALFPEQGSDEMSWAELSWALQLGPRAPTNHCSIVHNCMLFWGPMLTLGLGRRELGLRGAKISLLSVALQSACDSEQSTVPRSSRVEGGPESARKRIAPPNLHTHSLCVDEEQCRVTWWSSCPPPCALIMASSKFFLVAFIYKPDSWDNVAGGGLSVAG
jgi:hypothetical protein